MRRHLLTIGLILTGATGCDNVAFDGVQLAVLPPPTTTVEPAPTAVEDEGPVNVEGTLLLAGVRDGTRATLTLVGEVHGDQVVPFPDARFQEEDQARLAELTAPGSEWILFSEGARVGRLFVDASGSADGMCGGPATVAGVVELVPTAAAAERLMALPAADATGRAYTEYQPLAHVYDQRVASLEIAQAAIPEYGATWPTQGVLDARKDIRAFALPGASGPYIAATFMYRDELAVAAPGQGAYALFIVGRQTANGHQQAYTSYRAVDTEGKGAQRYFDHLDWDGDGEDEILLEVLGADRSWFAGLAETDGAWAPAFQSSCGSGSPTGG